MFHNWVINNYCNQTINGIILTTDVDRDRLNCTLINVITRNNKAWTISVCEKIATHLRHANVFPYPRVCIVAFTNPGCMHFSFAAVNYIVHVVAGSGKTESSIRTVDGSLFIFLYSSTPHTCPPIPLRPPRPTHKSVHIENTIVL